MRSKSDKKKSLVPRLRFPEFREAGAWEEKKIEDYFSVRSSKRVLQKDWKTHGVPFYRTRELVSLYNNEPFSSEIFISEELFSEIAKKYGFPSEGDFLVSGVGTLGICYQVKAKDKFYFKDGNVLWYKQNGGIVSSFFYYCFHSDQIQNQILGQASISTVGTYTIQNAKVTKFLCPTVEKEQQKIAHCLSSLDEVIGLQAKKVQALKQHKKGLMQQLFPAEGETTPRLRFPEFREAGAWEVKELIKLAGRGTERNQKGKIKRVLTNSAEHGVLDQREYFDKDIAIQGNLENYFVVDQGDFVYNPRISSFAPVGPISRNDVGKGVMSPLYTVFSFRQSDTDFFAHYFNSSAWHSYMRKVGSTGARHDRMAISNSDFLAMPLSVPNPKEQQKIAHCLSSLDEVIGLESHKLDALKNLKKGLMQQLFPQEVA
ncbi:restriction endonuclease subunit S [Thiolapillus sp.]|uniref:restriction endonuclease subunit S n=3 Tax=Thiolapillus sp. TaxID=2017437 RepID=UPI003AF98D14